MEVTGASARVRSAADALAGPEDATTGTNATTVRRPTRHERRGQPLRPACGRALLGRAITIGTPRSARRLQPSQRHRGPARAAVSFKEEPARRTLAEVMFATCGQKERMLTGSERYGAQGDNDRHAHRRRTGARHGREATPTNACARGAIMAWSPGRVLA